MPTISTQTDISTVSEQGFNNWCIENRDIVDGIPFTHTTQNLRKRMFLTAFPKGLERPVRHTI
jgi:hypothetical protein